MGLFYPTLFVPEEYPPPPRSGWENFILSEYFSSCYDLIFSFSSLVLLLTRFHDHEDMLEDAWHMDFTRKPDMSDGLYLGSNGGVSMWDNYQVYPTRLKKDESVGLAEAITTSILSTGTHTLFACYIALSIWVRGGFEQGIGEWGMMETHLCHLSGLIELSAKCRGSWNTLQGVLQRWNGTSNINKLVTS